ncbi:MAG TPA: zinc-dependent metalloprotease [Actinomycetes bacterium]|nr:zinc-dependent metalloprotease [Actinomycetes bacterium]
MPETSALVDWNLAARLGAGLAGRGPAVTPEEAREVVLALRAGAAEARVHVRAYTGLDAPTADAPVEVVDRRRWIEANAQGLARLFAPLEEVLRSRVQNEALRRVGGTLTGSEVGAALAWMSGKVLGQFDIYAGLDDGRPGRLLLVAPNVAQVERELGVDRGDFRLWVCLHEETHRVQFTAVPWLRDHLVGEVRELLLSVGRDAQSGELAERLRDLAQAVGEALRGGGAPAVDHILQSPEQRERMARLTAVMSLLEGHADVVMDGVGPDVVPSVAEIRARFQERREHPGRIEAAMRRLLGLDAKLRQYRDGAAFVRGVLDAAGMEGFNRVWERPANLPSDREIQAPGEWVHRVLG